MKRKYLILLIIAVLTIVVGLMVNYAAHDAIREALARAYQVVYAIANAIPQPYYWLLLILIILVSAARSLLGDAGWRPRWQPEITGGRTAEWREWLERAAQPGRAAPFYRWLLARNLARLASKVLAHQQGISPSEAERQIEDGDIVFPVDIQQYFLASLRSRPTHPGSLWSRLFHPQTSDPLDLDPLQAVELIENQMEVPHDNRHP